MSRKLVSSKHVWQYWTWENLRTLRSCFARNSTKFLMLCGDSQRRDCEKLNACIRRGTLARAEELLKKCRKVRIDSYAFGREIAHKLPKRKRRGQRHP